MCGESVVATLKRARSSGLSSGTGGRRERTASVSPGSGRPPDWLMWEGTSTGVRRLATVRREVPAAAWCDPSAGTYAIRPLSRPAVLRELSGSGLRPPGAACALDSLCCGWSVVSPDVPARVMRGMEILTGDNACAPNNRLYAHSIAELARRPERLSEGRLRLPSATTVGSARWVGADVWAKTYGFPQQRWQFRHNAHTRKSPSIVRRRTTEKQ